MIVREPRLPRLNQNFSITAHVCLFLCRFNKYIEVQVLKINKEQIAESLEHEGI